MRANFGTLSRTRHDAPSRSPPVIAWFHAYSVIFVLMYLAVAAFGIVFFVVDPATFKTELDMEMEPMFAKIMGAVFIIMGLGFAVVSAIPLLFSPRPWVWVYSLVLICLGLTSPCFLPFSIPLMIFWLKPETKAYYGKQ
jgi:hypothetical protein